MSPHGTGARAVPGGPAAEGRNLSFCCKIGSFYLFPFFLPPSPEDLTRTRPVADVNLLSCILYAVSAWCYCLHLAVPLCFPRLEPAGCHALRDAPRPAGAGQVPTSSPGDAGPPLAGPLPGGDFSTFGLGIAALPASSQCSILKVQTCVCSNISPPSQILLLRGLVGPGRSQHPAAAPAPLTAGTCEDPAGHWASSCCCWKGQGGQIYGSRGLRSRDL